MPWEDFSDALVQSIHQYERQPGTYAGSIVGSETR